MSTSRVKEIITIIVIIVASETLRIYSGLPITILDIILLPISFLLIYWGVLYFASLGKKKDSSDEKVMQSIWRLLGSLILFIILVPLCFWLTTEGWKEPFTLFSGVKGSVHGYSVVHIGIVSTVYCIGILFHTVQRLIRKVFKPQ